MTDVKQTGAERLEQVRKALAWYATDDDSTGDRALAALDGCVLLTDEEAGNVKRAIDQVNPSGVNYLEVDALLTPGDTTPDADDGPGEGPADEHNLEMGC